MSAGTTTPFAADVRSGLSKPGQKELPSKYFYDEVGSTLFEVISVLPEYGLTRADERLLRRHAEEIVDRIGSPVLAAELGSGSAKKTRWILEALCRRQPTTYYPIEISPSALAQCAIELGQMKCLSIVGFERSYTDGLVAVAGRRREHERLLVLFLGSTIGNFDRDAGEHFLRKVRDILSVGDRLLLGTDLVKEVWRMHLAYDDPLGVTAAFNLNLLARINRELDGHFDLARFEHVALYNEAARRIEMHLRSTERQTIAIEGADLKVEFLQGETIWTE
ncbi:MAG: L-histidine N(alpha)-methyltransferase, partial [Acidobacteria bacterium]|nr:L-histidine N(alpha)-methyltransferase [Acidobacteriota bacterium]